MKFIVQVKKIEIYEVEIEAEHEGQAMDLGEATMEDQGFNNFHSDSEVEIEAFEVD